MLRTNRHRWLVIAATIAFTAFVFVLLGCTSSRTAPQSKNIVPTSSSAPNDKQQSLTNLITDDNFVHGGDFVREAIADYVTTQNMFPVIRTRLLEIQGHKYSLAEAINLVSVGSKRSHEINPRVIITLIKLKEMRDGSDAVTGEWLVSLADTLSTGYIERAFRGAQTVHVAEGQSITVPESINAGTFAVYSALAEEASGVSDWKTLIGQSQESFLATYSDLFGSPLRRQISE